MADRTINFGESETEATYQIQDTDTTGGGNFVLAKDTNANTVLLEYDPATDTWEYAGDVDMNGGNVSGVGTLTADSVNTGVLGIEGKDYLNHIEDVSVESGNTANISNFDDITDSTSGREIIIALRYTDGGTQQDLYLRMNGDGDSTGNYDYELNGTTTNDANEIPLITQSGSFTGGWMTLALSRVYEPIVSVSDARVRKQSGTIGADAGLLDESTADLSSVQLIPSAGADAVINARVFEREI